MRWRNATRRSPPFRSQSASRPTRRKTLIEDAVVGRLKVLAVTPADYRTVLGEVAALGLRSGAVYDALHAQSARNAGVD